MSRKTIETILVIFAIIGMATVIVGALYLSLTFIHWAFGPTPYSDYMNNR